MNTESTHHDSITPADCPSRSTRAAAFLVLAERLGIIDQGGPEVSTDGAGGTGPPELALPAV
jgi:hypothetical protein